MKSQETNKMLLHINQAVFVHVGQTATRRFLCLGSTQPGGLLPQPGPLSHYNKYDKGTAQMAEH